MTDIDALFSDDTRSFFRSPVREIFKRVDLNAIYSFAGGYPSAETFPLERFREIMGEVIARDGGKAFQYGATQGVTKLREALSVRYGVPLDRIQITSSSQQGIDVCTRILVNPGDVILASNPSYLGALQSFRSYRAEVVGVKTVADLEEFRRRWENAVLECENAGKKIKFLYAIADFQNPSGETLSLGQREILVRLAREHGFLIVEDSPYRELRYEGEPVPTIYSLDPEIVLHLGSFSKIMAPGFRLGWIFGNPEVLDKIYVCKQSLDLESVKYCEGSANAITRVGVCSGSGGDLLRQAKELGCQALITGDVKHSVWIEAHNLGMALIDAGHYGTEKCASHRIAALLSRAFPDIPIFAAESEKEPCRYV